MLTPTTCATEAASPALPALPAPALLAGQLAPASLTGYRRDVALYQDFCATALPPLAAPSLARWRTPLAQTTRLSPHTINRRLAAVKRLVREAAAQGLVAEATAAALQRVAGVPVKALRHRLKTTTRTRLTPAHMRQLCEAPARTTLRGWRDRALLHTLASSGARVSEVVALTTAQIQSREGSFVVEVWGKNQTAPRLAPLSHEAYASLQAWRTSSRTTSGALSARSWPSAICAWRRQPWAIRASKPRRGITCSMSCNQG